MRTIILPYKIGSQSARDLSASLSAFRRRVIGPYLPRSEDFIINWGLGSTPPWFNAYRGVLGVENGLPQRRFLNLPEAVANAANKLRTFRILQEANVPTVEFTRDINQAGNWIQDGGVVYERHRLTGHSGEGIRVVQDLIDLSPAPLYTLAVENQGEYRVHVVNGRVIDYTKKRRERGDDPEFDEEEVRNLDTGWIYSRNNLRRLERVEQLALDAIAAMGLDFGAVDIIMDEDGEVFVLEVNSAPGLAPTTCAIYTEAFNNLIQEYYASRNG